MFGITSQIAVSSTPKTSSRIAGDQIVLTTFKSVKSDDFQAKSGTVYKTLFFVFEDEEGKTYEHRVFEPRPEDGKDKEQTDKNGGKYMVPARSKELASWVFNLMHVVNPSLAEKITNGSAKFAPDTWEKFRQATVKALTPGVGVKVQIKLIKNQDGYATTPSFFLAYVWEKGENKSDVSKARLWQKTQFFAAEGAVLEFTDYEKAKVEERANAKPSKPANSRRTESSPTSVFEISATPANDPFSNAPDASSIEAANYANADDEEDFDLF